MTPLVTSLFSDHMVLQQKSNVKFWGTDKPNNEITISTSWENESKTIVLADNLTCREYKYLSGNLNKNGKKFNIASDYTEILTTE